MSDNHFESVRRVRSAIGLSDLISDKVFHETAAIISGWSVMRIATVDANDPEWIEHIATAGYVLRYLTEALPLDAA